MDGFCYSIEYCVRCGVPLRADDVCYYCENCNNIINSDNKIDLWKKYRLLPEEGD